MAFRSVALGFSEKAKLYRAEFFSKLRTSLQDVITFFARNSLLFKIHPNMTERNDTTIKEIHRPLLYLHNIIQ